MQQYVCGISTGSATHHIFACMMSRSMLRPECISFFSFQISDHALGLVTELISPSSPFFRSTHPGKDMPCYQCQVVPFPYSQLQSISLLHHPAPRAEASAWSCRPAAMCAVISSPSTHPSASSLASAPNMPDMFQRASPRLAEQALEAFCITMLHADHDQCANCTCGCTTCSCYVEVEVLRGPKLRHTAAERPHLR